MDTFRPLQRQYLEVSNEKGTKCKMNTSLAAPGSFVYRQQHYTSFKIQKGLQWTLNGQRCLETFKEIPVHQPQHYIFLKIQNDLQWDPKHLPTGPKMAEGVQSEIVPPGHKRLEVKRCLDLFFRFRFINIH